jgi:hypothetical protein
MLNLPTTTSLIQVVTGAAVNAIEIHASWIDLSIPTQAVAPGDGDQTLTTAATRVVVPPPPVGFVRNAKFLSINNTSATPCPVTVQHFDGATLVNLFSITLLPLYTIQYNTDGVGFVVYDEGGCILLAEC